MHNGRGVSETAVVETGVPARLDFTRQHKSLKGLSPAMASGVSDQRWAVEDIVSLIDEHAERATPRLADQLVG